LRRDWKYSRKRLLLLGCFDWRVQFVKAMKKLFLVFKKVGRVLEALKVNYAENL